MIGITIRAFTLSGFIKTERSNSLKLYPASKSSSRTNAPISVPEVLTLPSSSNNRTPISSYTVTKSRI